MLCLIVEDDFVSRDVPLGHGAKVFMTTGAADSQHIVAAFHANCDAYLVKPINRAKLEPWCSSISRWSYRTAKTHTMLVAKMHGTHRDPGKLVVKDEDVAN